MLSACNLRLATTKHYFNDTSGTSTSRSYSTMTKLKMIRHGGMSSRSWFHTRYTMAMANQDAQPRTCVMGGWAASGL